MKRLLIFVIAASFAASAFAQTGTIEIRRNGRIVASNQREPANAIRVLFIGNSLTYWNEMPMLTRRVAASLGPERPLATQFSGASGMTLKQHWDRGNALLALRNGRWDWVVLQPQSSETFTRGDETAKYARMFDEEIRKAGARTILFVTWPPPGSGESQSALTRRYAKLAKDLGAAVASVGPAMERLRRNGFIVLDPEGLHPNLRGSYLTACIFYSIIYGKSPAGATHTFETRFDIPESYRRDLENERIDDATAETIQQAAWDAVKGK